MKISLPENCNRIIDIINRHNFEAYIVGGCVRDFLCHLLPNDWDITTNASPEDIREIFGSEEDFSVIPTGEKYGTMTVFHRKTKESYEVTTYRFDGNYSDGRRPDNVQFSNELKDDLGRRDFTINAMAYCPEKGIVDFFEGQLHIQEKIICFVGDPTERIREDGLRIMRAIRFSYKLQFAIEKNSFDAIDKAIDGGFLDHISKERIRDELLVILQYFDFKSKTYPLFEKMLFRIIPELKSMVGVEQYNRHHVFDLWEHSLIAMINTPNDAILRMTLLLHDIGKLSTFTLDDSGEGHFYGHPKVSCDISREILNRLKFDNKTKETILLLIENHDAPFMCTKRMVKRMLGKIGKENFEILLNIRFADAAAHNPRYIYDKCIKIQTERDLYEQIIKNDECFSLKKLAINGNDLMLLGIKGREIGKCLNSCLESVIDGSLENGKDTLVKFILSKIN